MGYWGSSPALLPTTQTLYQLNHIPSPSEEQQSLKIPTPSILQPNKYSLKKPVRGALNCQRFRERTFGQELIRLTWNFNKIAETSTRVAAGAPCATVAQLAYDNGAYLSLQRAHTVRGPSPGAIPHRPFSPQPSLLFAFILSVLFPWRNLSIFCLLRIVCGQILVTVTQLVFHPTNTAQSLLKPVPCGCTGHLCLCGYSVCILLCLSVFFF